MSDMPPGTLEDLRVARELLRWRAAQAAAREVAGPAAGGGRLVEVADTLIAHPELAAALAELAAMGADDAVAADALARRLLDAGILVSADLVGRPSWAARALRSSLDRLDGPTRQVLAALEPVLARRPEPTRLAVWLRARSTPARATAGPGLDALAAAVLVAGWYGADPARTRAAAVVAAEMDRPRPRLQVLEDGLRELGEELLPTPAGVFHQAAVVHRVARTPVTVQTLAEMVAAGADLRVVTGRGSVAEAVRAAERSERAVRDPVVRARRVVSGGLPELGHRR